MYKRSMDANCNFLPPLFDIWQYRRSFATESKILLQTHTFLYEYFIYTFNNPILMQNNNGTGVEAWPPDYLQTLHRP